jgi:phosphatidylinositol glycan class M
MSKITRPASSVINNRRRIPRLLSLLENRPVFFALFIRILLVYSLPSLLDDGLLLRGVRYTDIDYDVFTDAAVYVSYGRSPYERHTYRYTPFLAQLLALPLGNSIHGGSSCIVGRLWKIIFSTRYFGKILFCVADVICGFIIVVLRRRQRRQRVLGADTATPIRTTRSNMMSTRGWREHYYHYFSQHVTPELIDALWWLYNPLPINICTRGSAESLIVLLPVLATVAVADAHEVLPSLLLSKSSEEDKSLLVRHEGGGGGGRASLVMLRACIAGIFHGIGIHFKLYPVIYTISFMANFSRQQQRQHHTHKSATNVQLKNNTGWEHPLSDERSEKLGLHSFPWTSPPKIVFLGLIWMQRLFFTMSSM